MPTSEDRDRQSDELIEERIRAALPGSDETLLDPVTRARIAERVASRQARAHNALPLLFAASGLAAVLVLAIVGINWLSGRVPPQGSLPNGSSMPESAQPSATAQPTATESPEPELARFGRLPEVSPQTTGGVTGPGGAEDMELTFTMADEAILPTVPATADVIRTSYRSWTRTEAIDAAARLGLDGEPREDRYIDRVAWTWEIGGARLEIDSAGWLRYSNTASGAAVEASDDELAARAVTWLEERSLLPEHVGDTPMVRAIGDGRYELTFVGEEQSYRAPIDGPFPFLTLTVYGDGAVSAFDLRWAEVSGASAYPLRPADDIEARLSAGEGRVGLTPQAGDPMPVPSGSATAIISEIGLDYALTARPEGRVVYVVPVYVVRGAVTWADGDTATFSALLSAIDAPWVEGNKP